METATHPQDAQGRSSQRENTESEALGAVCSIKTFYGLVEILAPYGTKSCRISSRALTGDNQRRRPIDLTRQITEKQTVRIKRR
ncbi:hypothetical protein RRG08_065052 [Elysia crispata]|uniref:Uncharacterized protein n=1 Tax=Elysia crispata TaxID=231223 RepID=A0AAE0ZL73_9GAST|nr:hypothetical protein RRG08_065052 [Elysia crispata]